MVLWLLFGGKIGWGSRHSRSATEKDHIHKSSDSLGKNRRKKLFVRGRGRKLEGEKEGRNR
jgi:hypothetical protein